MTNVPRFATIRADGHSHYGLIGDSGFTDLSGRFGQRWATLRDVIADGGLQELADAGSGLDVDFNHGEFAYALPVPDPEKIICVGVNYPDRNAEYKDGQEAPPRPSLFPRFARSFVGHNEPLVRPPESSQLDYEGEIVLIVGKGGRRITEHDALDHVAAVTLCNEGTIRDWVRHAKFNVTQGKNWDASGAIGPWFVPLTDEAQIADIRLTTHVNGSIRQDDHTSRMLFSFRYLVAYISTFTTLVPGDVIVTGTPTGAGARFDPPIWLEPGDVVEVAAEGIGSLRSTIINEQGAQ